MRKRQASRPDAPLGRAPSLTFQAAEPQRSRWRGDGPVLLQPAYPSERANGVAISRNILDPIYGSHYLDAQVGEALVTNPAPSVSTEELTFRFWGGPI